MFGPSHSKERCNAKTIPITCRFCGEEVYYFSCDHGAKVFFEKLGPPWTRHIHEEKTGVVKVETQTDFEGVETYFKNARLILKGVKCYRLFRPKISKGKVAVSPHGDTVSPPNHACDFHCTWKPSDLVWHISTLGINTTTNPILLFETEGLPNLSNRRIGLQRLNYLSFSDPFRSTKPRLFCGCPLPRSTSQRVAPVERFAP